MTRLSRQLGRDYRVRFGIVLSVDARGIRGMESGIRRDDRRRDRGSRHDLEGLVMRHGALLSEIFARRLGAEWVEVDGPPADWSMQISPDIRVWPVWRVQNLLRLEWTSGDGLVRLFEALRARAGVVDR
jgi:hypothetical protein